MTRALLLCVLLAGCVSTPRKPAQEIFAPGAAPASGGCVVEPPPEPEDC